MKKTFKLEIMDESKQIEVSMYCQICLEPY